SSLPCLRRSSSVALGGRYPGFHSGSGTSVISAMYFPLGGHLPCEDSDLKSDSVMWNVMLMVCTPCGTLACGTRWLRVRREKRFRRGQPPPYSDRKSTRLNSSHVKISYAVFCL